MKGNFVGGEKGGNRVSRPLSLLILTSLSVFVGETWVMLLLNALPPLPRYLVVFLDASLVTALVLPVLYLFLFRPMMVYISEREKAQEALSKLSNAVEQTADGVVITGKDGVIEYVNPAFEEQTGYTRSEAIGQNPRILKSGVHGTEFYETLWGTILAGRTFRGEIINKRKNGEHFYAEHTITPLKDQSGEIKHFVSVWKDVTERKRAEDTLREQEARLRLLVEQTPAILWTTDTEERFTSTMGAGLLSLKGHIAPSPGTTVTDFHNPTDVKSRASALHHRALQGETVSFDMEIEDRVFHAHLEPLRDSQGKISGSVGVALDITERKQAEEALQTFSQRVMDAQEAERCHIARELHDEMGQSLTALYITLQQAVDQPGEVPMNAQLLGQCIDSVERLLQQVRSLSLDLRPSLLDDLGLAAALRWYVDRQGQLAGFTPDFQLDPLEARLPPDIETACFRVAQEAVTNVVRHANASSVRVVLRQNDGEMEMIITDDGKGFSVTSLLKRDAREASAGLLGMRERVLLLGGKIDIDSEPERGTEIRVRIPVQKGSSVPQEPGRDREG